MWNKKVVILPSVYIGLCVGLLLFPIGWLFAWFSAATIHELGHMIALRIFRIPITGMKISLNGAYIETGYIPPNQEWLCALAGPILGLSCLMLTSLFPLVAIFGFVQTVYNLLPFPNYDGGRAVYILLEMCFPTSVATKVYKVIIFISSVILVMFGFYLWISLGLGVMCMLICLLPVIKSYKIKTPCKQLKLIVQ